MFIKLFDYVRPNKVFLSVCCSLLIDYVNAAVRYVIRDDKQIFNVISKPDEQRLQAQAARQRN